jgi:hypothetical protein
MRHRRGKAKAKSWRSGRSGRRHLFEFWTQPEVAAPVRFHRGKNNDCLESSNTAESPAGCRCHRNLTTHRMQARKRRFRIAYTPPRSIGLNSTYGCLTGEKH